MNKKYKLACLIFLLVVAASVAAVYIFSDRIAVLNPKGIIALKERNLILLSLLLMLIVVIPVLFMIPYFSWKYRATNKNAIYAPDWDYSLAVELIWWGIPTLIIIALSIITWKSSFALDPYKPLDDTKKPVEVQVVALQWKWLFIYPEEGVATLNFFRVPENTPIDFEITADAPMNSFWIPELGGQVYAMPGMKTQLHLIANETGKFRGSSANLSGKGFAGMTFIAASDSEDDFLQWVKSVKESSKELDSAGYDALALPSENNEPEAFVLKDLDLFEKIVMKYMHPAHTK